jgi:hypothetical protein
MDEVVKGVNGHQVEEVTRANAVVVERINGIHRQKA